MSEELRGELETVINAPVEVLLHLTLQNLAAVCDSLQVLIAAGDALARGDLAHWDAARLHALMMLRLYAPREEPDP